MMALFLLLACAGRADADGAPPGMDAATLEPAEDLSTLGDGSTVAEEVPARVIEGIDTLPAAELLTLTSPPEIQDVEEGEVEAGDTTESGGVVIDSRLLAVGSAGEPQMLVYSIPPNGGPSFLEKWSAEIGLLLAMLWAVVRRRGDVGGLIARLDSIAERLLGEKVNAPAPDEVQRVLAGQLADARQEVEALQRERALLLERERRAAQAEKDADQAKRAMERTPDMELLETLDAVGRAAEARDRALPPAV